MSTILGESYSENLGSSCALNAAGNILAVGSPNFDIDTITNGGKLQIFQYINSTWENMSTILGTTSEQLGNSCALNAAGNIVAVGSYLFSDTITNRGKLQIFQYINSSWQNMSTIFGSASEQLGYSCALNAAGNILAIGSNRFTTPGLGDRGKIQIFQYQNSTWQNMNTILGETYTESLGFACSLNAAGNILAVSSQGFDLDTTNTGAGKLQIFQYINSSWQNMSTIRGEKGSMNLGYSCALNAAGNILAVGSPFFELSEFNNNRGRLQIYQYTNSKWQIMTTILGNTNNEKLGFSCSLNAAGNILAVGGNCNPGNLQIYQYKNLTWQNISTISGPGESLGYSCALNAAGNILAVGSQDFSSNDIENRGKLQVFESQPANLNMDAGTGSGSLQTITIGENAYSTTIGYPGSQFTVNTNINTSSINNATIVFDTLNSNAAVFNGKFGIGDGNTALGTYSLYSNTSGSHNTAVGAFALEMNASGNNNTAIGMYALINTSGSNNTAIGTYADQYTQNTNSSNNTAIGFQAYTASNNTSLNPVSNSTVIGANATTNGFSNSTAIGYNASSTAINQIILGTSTETVVMPGNLSSINASFVNVSIMNLTVNGTLFGGGSSGPNVSFTNVSVLGNFSMPSSAYMNVSNASFTNVSMINLTINNINGQPYTGGTVINSGATLVTAISNVSNVNISNSSINTINISGNSIISQNPSNTTNGIFISCGSTMTYPSDAIFNTISVTNTGSNSLVSQGIISAISFNSTSDLRMKDIIRLIQIDEASKLINNNAVLFKWKNSENELIQSGYIAQEIINSGFAHLVTEINNSALKEPDGPEGKQYVLNYDGIIPYHGVILKHLLNENNKLKEEMRELKEEMKELKEEMRK
jgi:hypothetical protein